MDKPEWNVNVAYVLDQLERALAHAAQVRGGDDQGRAAARVARLRRVLSGMRDGTLTIGSRTPVADVPAWATLEVAHGGFATGRLLAGGPLASHEQTLAARLGLPVDETSRTQLNAYFLGDEGRAALQTWLDDGRYRIDVPEESALLVVAWLLAHGEGERAATLLDELAPLMHRLRFYPIPADTPRPSGTAVQLAPLRDTVSDLESAGTQRHLQAMREAITIWTPLYDELVALFLTTVEGATPRLSAPSGRAEGGWPCAQFPSDFRARGQALLERYRALRTKHKLSGKPENPRENFARLRGYLEQWLADARSLTPRDVGSIRKILASYVTKHGAPGSEQLLQKRARDARNAAQVDHTRLRDTLVARLRRRADEGGLTSLDEVLRPLDVSEAERIGAPPGTLLPRSFRARVAHSLEAPIEVLVAQKIVTSHEVLARLLPTSTAEVSGATFADAALRRLHEATYAAFRRRRSLLLKQLAHQVKLDELPWLTAIDGYRGDALGARGRARDMLQHVAALALDAYPEQVLPNKLLQEFAALAKLGALDLPLVEELAVDIWEGTFTAHFLRAAQTAALLLRETLYERYYGLPYARVLELDVEPHARSGKLVAPAFARLCEQLAQPPAEGRYTARNGMIIEQQQLFTTHNLAVLFATARLTPVLGERLPQLAQRCFTWLCRRLQVKVSDRHADLIHIKSAAYAFRQMLFYLSLSDLSAQQAFATWARAHVSAQRSLAFRTRFEPVLRGLELCIEGDHFDERGQHLSGARRLLAWSATGHWLASAPWPSRSAPQ